MRLVAVALAELDGPVPFLGAAIDADGDRIAGALAVQKNVHIELIGDLLPIDSNNHVAANRQAAHSGLDGAIAAVNSSGSGRAALGGLFHKKAFLHVRIEGLGEPYGQFQLDDVELSTAD